MKILLKKHVEYYRYTVAKVVFLQVYNQYHLLKDITESNIMLVVNNNSQEKLCISILKKPTCNSLRNYRTNIYYLEPEYKRQKNKNRNELSEDYSIHSLNSEFENLFKTTIEEAFTDGSSFLKKFDYSSQHLFDYYYSIAEKEIVNHGNQFFYKYFSKDKVKENAHKVNDGIISFSHPKYFNDPFDCNCSLSSNEDMRDRFRVLCLTPNYKNILMWSYYSQNHEGYCFPYYNQNIVEKVKALNIPGVCIFGNVKYKDKRPPQKKSVCSFSFTDLVFYIDATFTKYKKWKHEQEFRFVIFSKDEMKDFEEIELDVSLIYEGCQGAKVAVSNSLGKELKIIKLIKDTTAYTLRDKG